MERKVGGGILEIATIFSGEDLLITVRDSGVGIDEERLKELRNHLEQPTNILKGEHIGLKNVHDQIRYYYGEAYGIEIESALGDGTMVTIRVPMNGK